MINPQWLELPMSRPNFHGPKDVRAIEVRLYIENIVEMRRNCSLGEISPLFHNIFYLLLDFHV